MPEFKIVPVDRSLASWRFTSRDASPALNLIERHRWSGADVFKDDQYLFTARRGGPLSACWIIETNTDRGGAKDIAVKLRQQQAR